MHFSLALLKRHLLADLGSLRMTLTRLVVQPAVYLYVFGYVVGSMISGGEQGYAAMMGPGIVAIVVMTAPLGVVGGSLVSGYYFRTLEGWLLAPVSLYQLLLAKIVSWVVYGTLSAAIVALLVWVILGVAPVAVVPALMLVIVGSALFSLLSLLVLLLPGTPDKGQELFSFLLMPMTFFGCTFYSHAMLEPPFSQLALLLPTTYIAGDCAPVMPPRSHTFPWMPSCSVCHWRWSCYCRWQSGVFRRRLGDYLW